MPLHHAVLALLSQSSSYGYELKASFEEAVGPQWGELNIGHLYQILERLSRDGFVTKRVVSQSDRPDKTVYRVTKAGRGELDKWLSEPHVGQTGYRDDFFLKLFAGARVSDAALKNVIDTQRSAYLVELKALRDLQSQQQVSSLVGLLITAAIHHTEANLKVVEAAAGSIEMLRTEWTSGSIPDANIDHRQSG